VTVGDPPRGDRALDESEGLGRDHDGASVRRVEPRDLTAGAEATPLAFENLDEVSGPLVQTGRAAEHDDPGFAAHGPEPSFDAIPRHDFGHIVCIGTLPGSA